MAYGSLFRDLTDKRARFYNEKEAVNDIIYRHFYHTLKGKGSFDAVVLSGQGSGDQSVTPIGSDNYVALKVRPLDIHEFALPSPCDKRYANKERKRLKILSLHPTAYSQILDEANGDNMPEFGTIVECYFDAQGPSSGKLRGLRWRMKAQNIEANYDFDCQPLESLLDKFGVGGTLMGDYVDIPDESKTYETTTEFIQAMRDHNGGATFKDFHDGFLAALAANAQAESALGRHTSDTIRWPAGDRIKTSDSEARQLRAINGYCSHGYWQMNVCPEGAEGSLFASHYSFDVSTDQGKRDYITAVLDEDILFDYISHRMKQIPEIEKTRTGNKSAYSCAWAICFYFEQPQDKKTKSKQRGKKAKEIYERYIADTKKESQ